MYKVTYFEDRIPHKFHFKSLSDAILKIEAIHYSRSMVYDLIILQDHENEVTRAIVPNKYGRTQIKLYDSVRIRNADMPRIYDVVSLDSKGNATISDLDINRHVEVKNVPLKNLIVMH